MQIPLHFRYFGEKKNPNTNEDEECWKADTKFVVADNCATRIYVTSETNTNQFQSVLVCLPLTGLLLGGAERCLREVVYIGGAASLACCAACCIRHHTRSTGEYALSVDRCRPLNTCSRVSNGCAERHRLLYFRSAVPGCSMCITRPAPGWRGPLQTRRPRAAADGTQLVRVHQLPRSEFVCCNPPKEEEVERSTILSSSGTRVPALSKNQLWYSKSNNKVRIN